MSSDAMPPSLPPDRAIAPVATPRPNGPTGTAQIIYWGLTDWEGLTQRPQHLAEELSRHYHVLYLRPVPLSRLWSARRGLPPAVEWVNPRLVVLRPRALSPGRLAPLARLNDWHIGRLVRSHLRLDQPRLLWLSHPDQASQIGHYGERLVCFDEMDLHAAFKQGPARAAMAAAERALLRRADLVITSGHDLHAHAVAAGARPLLVPNGVLFERFAAAATTSLALPGPLASLPRPRLLFYGTFGPWLDTELLAAIADARPAWTIVLFGSGSGADLSYLAGRANVHRLGWQPYELLPAYLQHVDVCLLPFKDTAATRAMDPVKLYEYLAAGKPVVATGLPELDKWGDLVDIAEGPDATVAAIERHLRSPEGPERRRRRLSAAAEHTWARRATSIVAALEAALADGPHRA